MRMVRTIILLIVIVLITVTGNAIAEGENLQLFKGNLLDTPAPPVIQKGNNFIVNVDGVPDGKAFNNSKSALQHSCNIQGFICNLKVIAGKGRSQGINGRKCKQQRQDCSNTTTNSNNVQTKTNTTSTPAAVNEPTPATGFNNDASFCSAVGLGNALSDGTQKKTQTCSVTVQGAIPTFDKMVSTIILSPKSGEKIKMGTDVKVKVRTNNMQLGFFEDPNKRYYQSPQTLNNQGVIEGHQHLTVQDLGDGQTPPDPRTDSLAFFKGLDQKSDNQGILEVTVPGDSFKRPGEYRFCTITGSRSHQPVIMPVAKRGSQDDCIRVIVI